MSTCQGCKRNTGEVFFGKDELITEQNELRMHLDECSKKVDDLLKQKTCILRQDHMLFWKDLLTKVNEQRTLLEEEKERSALVQEEVWILRHSRCEPLENKTQQLEMVSGRTSIHFTVEDTNIKMLAKLITIFLSTAEILREDYSAPSHIDADGNFDATQICVRQNAREKH